MTIYDDIMPARSQHMNEDERSPWKQCENSKCARIFNVVTEGMKVITFDIKPGYPKDSLMPMKKIYCLRCGEATWRHTKEMEEDIANGILVPCCGCGSYTYHQCYVSTDPNKTPFSLCEKCTKEYNSIVINELKKIVVEVVDRDYIEKKNDDKR